MQAWVLAHHKAQECVRFLSNKGVCWGGHQECWVLHASPEWSRRHLEIEPGQVQETLLADFARVCSPASLHVVQTRAHLWRFALARTPLTEGHLSDPERSVLACGDWAQGSRVEGAFLSGWSAAEAIFRSAS